MKAALEALPGTLHVSSRSGGWALVSYYYFGEMNTFRLNGTDFVLSCQVVSSFCFYLVESMADKQKAAVRRAVIVLDRYFAHDAEAEQAIVVLREATGRR